MEVAAVVVGVREQTDVADARRRACERARQAGFNEVETGRVAIAVTEAATNLLKHGGGGEMVIGPAPALGGAGLQVLALDRGRGMRDIPGSLRDGVSTAGTSGTGLGAIARAAAAFDVYSEPGGGTVLAATFLPEKARPIGVGAVSVAVAGEHACGDGWAVWSAGELTSVFVCDGLGHGPQAAAATEAALATFRRHGERSAPDILTLVHDALRPTRGAAVALAELDFRQQSVRYCGLGNISAAIFRPGGDAQHLVSLSGIAGHVMRRLQPFTYAWPRGSVLVMHSDGVDNHWSARLRDGLRAHSAPVIAGVILRDHRRQRDDATVAVVRNGEPA
jgi:anti-sigma regulatory factor (Ser/Thr protein kinase)